MYTEVQLVCPDSPMCVAASNLELISPWSTSLMSWSLGLAAQNGELGRDSSSKIKQNTDNVGNS